MESVQRVARIVKEEEHRYATTFQVAERVFQDEAKKAAGGVLPGAAAFKLYDTYGLALDEQAGDGAGDRPGHRHGRLQPRDGGAARRGPAPVGKAPRRRRSRLSTRQIRERGRTEFLGYDTLEATATVAALIQEDAEADELSRRRQRPSSCWTARRSTPSPADRWATGVRSIRDAGEKVATRRPTPTRRCPGCRRSQGRSRSRRSGRATSSPPGSRRGAAPPRMRNHTATHLLHAALARRCSARTSSRPAAWSTPAACVSISPTTRRWTPTRSPKSSAS